MEQLFEQSHIYLFLLIFVRVSGIFVTAPIFSTRIIPVHIKVLISLYLSYVVLQFHGLSPLAYKDIHLFIFAILILTEAIIGTLIGFIANLAFNMIQFGGRLLDILMGMHIASIMDPLSREQQSLIGQLQYIIVILLFLTFNGHHLIILGLVQSFDILPIGTLTFTSAFSETFLKIISQTFILGMKFAAPIMAILFLIDFCLGVIAKSVPQMNVFLTGMPLKALSGFMLFFLLFIFYGSYFSSVPELMFEHIITILRVL
ncbi:MAG: flagellar biosynthetic protein FliR [Candidatus Margulisbacteria bacterium]|nr:flagellar biosynthetic protein FliR [Candidatus Margulisiibacteriota bacterium]